MGLGGQKHVWSCWGHQSESFLFFTNSLFGIFACPPGPVTFSYYLTGAHSDFHLAVLCATGHLLDVAPSIPDVIVTSELR